MLAELETAIINRITTIVNRNEAIVSAFPAEDDKKAARQNRVFVGYKRSNFNLIAGEPFTVDQTLEFEISIMVKDLRTHTTVYPLLDRIRTTLTGYWFPLEFIAGKSYPIAEGFVDLEQGIWYYSFSFAVPIFNYEDPDTYIPEPEIKTIQSGLFRTKVGDLTDNTLDRNLEIPIDNEWEHIQSFEWEETSNEDWANMD